MLELEQQRLEDYKRKEREKYAKKLEIKRKKRESEMQKYQKILKQSARGIESII